MTFAAEDIEAWPDDWLRSSSLDLQARIRRHRILFVQSSPLHADAAERMIACLESQTLDATAFCELTDQQVENLASGPRIVALVGTEKLALAGAAHHLGKLRASAYTLNQSGSDLCILSLIPKSTYPDVPGSSILADSKSYYLPLLPVLDGDESGVSIFPATRGAEANDVREVFRNTLSTLSVPSLVALDRAVFELRDAAADIVKDLPAFALDELRGCGFVTADEKGEVRFSTPRRFVEFQIALGDAISEVVDAPDGYEDTVTGVFRIERMIRRKLRAMSIKNHGDRWRRLTFAGDFPARILDRAQQDAYPLVTSISEIRDPFEWLTLGELLEMIRQPSFGYLGRSSAFWSRFASEILPLRNRLSHMRLPTDEDSRVVRTWELLLGRAF